VRRSLLPILLAVFLSTPGFARVEEKTGYSKEQAFNATLRYLRIDRGYSIIEKDAETGYLMFEYPTDERKLVQGSVEMIPLENGVSLVIRIPALPQYHENMLSRGLLQKLRMDYGDKKYHEKPKEERDPSGEPPVETKPKEPSDEKKREEGSKTEPKDPPPSKAD
jgi:hypothetical protein